MTAGTAAVRGAAREGSPLRSVAEAERTVAVVLELDGDPHVLTGPGPPRVIADATVTALVEARVTHRLRAAALLFAPAEEWRDLLPGQRVRVRVVRHFRERGRRGRRPLRPWATHPGRRTEPAPAGGRRPAGGTQLRRGAGPGAATRRPAPRPRRRRHRRDGSRPRGGLPPRGARAPDRRVGRERRDRAGRRAVAAAPASRRPPRAGGRGRPGAHRVRGPGAAEPERRPRRRHGRGDAPGVGGRAARVPLCRRWAVRSACCSSSTRGWPASRVRPLGGRHRGHRAARPGLVAPAARAGLLAACWPMPWP